MPSITSTVATPAYTVSPIGTQHSIRLGGQRCTFRIRFDGACIVNTRQVLPEGSTFPSIPALAQALAGVNS